MLHVRLHQLSSTRHVLLPQPYIHAASGAFSNPKTLLLRWHPKFCLTLASRYRKLIFYASVFQLLVHNPLEILWVFLVKAGSKTKKNKSVFSRLIFAAPLGILLGCIKHKSLKTSALGSYSLAIRHLAVHGRRKSNEGTGEKRMQLEGVRSSNVSL